MRCNGTVRKLRCIVPVESGKHTDGNSDHYNGNSHYTKDGLFTRG